MGTRSITQVLDRNGDIIVSMYRQMDGYPSGHGEELAKFLESGKMVNGITYGQPERIFNGIEDMAAKMVEHFKAGQDGSIYLFAPRSREELANDIYIEYVYTVSFQVNSRSGPFGDPEGVFILEVDNGHGATFFGATPATFLRLLENGDLERLEEEAYDETVFERMVNT